MVQNWAIKTENLRKDYPGNTAVKGLDLAILQGAVHGFLGPNGAGKSTSLRMICGLLRPTSGHAFMMGVDSSESPVEAKRLVGWLPEVPPLYLDMTVDELLIFAARLRSVPKNEIAGHVDRSLQQAGLAHMRSRLIGNLSKGYRQRVGIAQALVHDPPLIVLDEPTAGLDPQSVVEIRELIQQLRGHKTVVFSSHILHEVEAVCDSVSIIDHGELLATGSMADVKNRFLGAITLVVELARPVTDEEASWLRTLSLVQSFSTAGNQLTIQPQGNRDVRTELVEALVARGLGVRGLEQRGADLEDVFLRLTKKRDV